VTLVHVIFDEADVARVPVLVGGQQIQISRDIVLTVVGVTPVGAPRSVLHEDMARAHPSSSPSSSVTGPPDHITLRHSGGDAGMPQPAFLPVYGEPEASQGGDSPASTQRRRSDAFPSRTAVLDAPPSAGPSEWRGHASHAELLIAGGDREPGRRSSGRSAVSARTLRSFRSNRPESPPMPGMYSPGSPYATAPSEPTEDGRDATASRGEPHGSDRISSVSTAFEPNHHYDGPASLHGAGGIAADSGSGRRTARDGALPHPGSGPVVVGIHRSRPLAPASRASAAPTSSAFGISTSMVPVPLETILSDATAAGPATARARPQNITIQSSSSVSSGRHDDDDAAPAKPSPSPTPPASSNGTSTPVPGADTGALAPSPVTAGTEHAAAMGGRHSGGGPIPLSASGAPPAPPAPARQHSAASVAAQNAAVAAAAAQAAGLSAPSAHGGSEWHGGHVAPLPLPPGRGHHPHAAGPQGQPGAMPHHPRHHGFHGTPLPVPPSPDVGSCRLFLNGVPAHVTEADIRDHFTRFGQVKDVYFPVFHAMVSAGTRGALSSVPTRKRRGFCFITMAVDADVDTALAYSDRVVGGVRVPEMRRARPRHATAPSPRSHGVTMALGPNGPAGRVVFPASPMAAPGPQGRHGDATARTHTPGSRAASGAFVLPLHDHQRPHQHAGVVPTSGGSLPLHPPAPPPHRVATSFLPGPLAAQAAFFRHDGGHAPPHHRQHHTMLVPGSFVVLPDGQRGTVGHDGRIMTGGPHNGHGFGRPAAFGPDRHGDHFQPPPPPPHHHLHSHHAVPYHHYPSAYDAPPRAAAADRASPPPPVPAVWATSAPMPHSAALAVSMGDSALAGHYAQSGALDDAFHAARSALPPPETSHSGGFEAAAASLAALSLEDDGHVMHPSLLGSAAPDGMFAAGAVGFSVLDPAIWQAE